MNNINIIKQLMHKGLTPKNVALQIMGNNPILANLAKMAENGDSKGVEEFARNIMKERGLDFDKQLEEFKNLLH